MFVGHYAVALAAKRATPRLSLPLLFAAVQFLDIVWPILILLGVEHARIVPGLTQASPLDLYDIPYSHSLVMSLVWSVLAAGGLLLFTRTPADAGGRGASGGATGGAAGALREASVLGLCVFSHFILDFVTHRPDLPLAPGSKLLLGLGLWNFRAAEVVVEASLFLAGIVVYARGTRAVSKMGSVGFVLFMVVLAGIWLGGVFGPPPPDIKVVAWSIVVSTPIILWWARGVDHARQARPLAPSGAGAGRTDDQSS